jgi:hypothetical protein
MAFGAAAPNLLKLLGERGGQAVEVFESGLL